MRKRWLPLGVDIGATRLRIAQAYTQGGTARLHAVAVRDISEGVASSGVVADTTHVAALLEDALDELGTRARRCIIAIGAPDALLKSVRFPKMSALERERSARFEAQRYAAFPVEETAVRVHPAQRNSDVWMLGIARNAAILTRCAALRAARLKPLAIDHEACALIRTFPQYDAILDIGHRRCTLHVSREDAPVTLQVLSGGSDLTRAIQRDLCLDELTAEKRKRILGTAGAGERARAALVTDIATLVEQGRRLVPIERVALCGNGARLPGLSRDLESATKARVETPVGSALHNADYPEDVIRSSAPDWTLAAALALWQR
jgi:type IV pilus assembly protein PilM